MNFRRILLTVGAGWVLFLAFVSGRNSVSPPAPLPMSAVSGAVKVSPPGAYRLGDEESAGWFHRLRRLAARETVHERLFVDVVNAWLGQDPEGAIQWLSPGPEGEDLLPWLVKLWSRQQPQEAQEWVTAQQESEGYRAAAQGLVLGLSESSPNAAFEWIATVSEPSLKLKLWTLAGYERYRRDLAWDGEELANADLPSGAREALQAAWKDRFHRQAERHAREIASLLAEAKASGVALQFETIEAAIEQVLKEAEGGSVLRNTLLPWQPLTSAEIQEIKDHLSMAEEGEIVYTPR